jgi:HlyD family secretion protein
MVAKGYFSLLQLMTEEQALRRATLSLAQARTAFEIYLRFSAPIALKVFQSDINGAQAAYDFQNIKMRREEERLALYERMVERCTVRAPHDGLVVYANRAGRTPEVYVGATVRQRQRLFYLPDLSTIEVEAMLHETVVSRVQAGMPARVRIEARPELELEGEVVAIAPLPYSERKTETGSEVTYFVGRVRLATIPEGLRPGMSAELEILTVHRRGVLAVPKAAVTIDAGREVCYVRRPEHLEQRPVKLGQGSYDLVEVLDGLAEGEDVVLPTH